MAIKPFVKANTNDIPLTILQNNLDSSFNSIFNVPIINGNFVQNISFTANKDMIISHGLDRAYQGIFVALKNNFGEIILSNSPNNNPNQQIILIASNNMVASLWIF